MTTNSLSIDLFPDTGFPYKQLKEHIGNTESPQDRFVVLSFQNKAGSKESGRITITVCDVFHLEICYESHHNGGRDRFESDMNHLIDLLLFKTSGYYLKQCRVAFSSCCDDLIPDAIALFSSKSSECGRHNALRLSERDGAGDPTVATNIVENWRSGSKGSNSACHFSTSDLTRHTHVLEAILTKPNVEQVSFSTRLPNYPMSAQALRLVSSRLLSPASTVRILSLDVVSSGDKSDRELASILETNKSLSRLNVLFDSESWVATEISRAMREVNCTIGEVLLWPVCKVGSPARISQEEIHLRAALNRYGRRFMRSMSFEPQKIPLLLETVGREERPRFGRYLYPMLRENPSKWTSYLAHRQVTAPTNSCI